MSVHLFHLYLDCDFMLRASRIENQGQRPMTKVTAPPAYCILRVLRIVSHTEHYTMSEMRGNLVNGGSGIRYMGDSAS